MASISASFATTSAAPATSSSGSNNNGNNNGFNSSAGFYKNLFFILIGLLALFGIVSSFTFLRARRRNAIIFAEARRLGLVVPGMDGYYEARDALVNLCKGVQPAKGTRPEIWDATPAKLLSELTGDRQTTSQSNRPVLTDLTQGLGCATSLKVDEQFYPLSVAPILHPPKVGPAPTSGLEIFPSTLAIPVALIEANTTELAPSDLLERWEAELAPPTGPSVPQWSNSSITADPAIQLSVLVRMPVDLKEMSRRNQRRSQEEVDDAAIQETFAGSEFGQIELAVVR